MKSRYLRAPRHALVDEVRAGILASVGAPMWPEHSLEIVKNGLRRTSRPRRIIVIGAGMAGLVAASLLKAAGHETVILEASARVGGRVRTLREPFVAGQYGEAGA